MVRLRLQEHAPKFSSTHWGSPTNWTKCSSHQDGSESDEWCWMVMKDDEWWWRMMKDDEWWWMVIFRTCYLSLFFWLDDGLTSWQYMLYLVRFSHSVFQVLRSIGFPFPFLETKMEDMVRVDTRWLPAESQEPAAKLSAAHFCVSAGRVSTQTDGIRVTWACYEDSCGDLRF